MATDLPTLDTGTPAPLGATWDGHGVNFAVFSQHAEKIELCLFDASARHQTACLALPARSGDIWHGYLHDAAPGLVYGYRAHGPYAPSQGHWFNPHKLLIDPYARALCGRFAWHDAVHGYQAGDPLGTASFDRRDSAPHVPKCRVTARPPPGERPSRPCTPWADTVLYELHVRGFSRLHPDLPAATRGTIAALAEPDPIAHFKRLGVTAIELLPTAAYLDERRLVQRGLRNYWGYNPIAWMAMHAPLLATGDVAEFARTVDRLHAAGLEVILDIVFNHTAESDASGPTLAYRGLDNATYYRLEPEHAERYVDDTGCGNTLDLSQPAVVDLVHASLRYWACEIGVDGFRLDLAPVLARDRSGAFDPHAPLLRAIASDPQLNALKWIAEPWDLGMPGHFLGRFPAPFAEWNDRYRDGTRRFWRGDRGMLGELATRFAGSSDVFGAAGRLPSASINFVTAHDGFTLADLTAYAEKHNEANGDDNRDGTPANWSSNGGIEGDTDDPAILERRRRRRQSLLGTLLLSRGTPMLRAGDELSQTRHGNNNAYCQDNVLNWLDWTARGDPVRDLRAFVEKAANLRRQLGLLRGDRYFDGRAHAGEAGLKDIAWLHPGGFELRPEHWQDETSQALAILLADTSAPAATTRQYLYLALNAGDDPVSFSLPTPGGVDDWLCVLDSAAPPHPRADPLHAPGSTLELVGGGLLALVPARTEGIGVTPDLLRKAAEAGVSAHYTDITGHRLQVPAGGLRHVLAALGDHAAAPPTVDATAGRTGDVCWLPAALTRPPGRWVLSAQIYSLRSTHGWGIGDFGDVARLLDIAAAAGADGLLCSPVHAPSLTQPQRASPYAPSSRLMLNPLLISIEDACRDVPADDALGFDERADLERERSRLNALETIDYPAVAALKLRTLRRLHDAFRPRHLDATPSALGAEFLRFRQDGGMPLRDHVVFEALDAWFVQQRGEHLPWRQWPTALHDPRGSGVAAFEDAHAREIEFFAYLQWLARRQWHAAAARADTLGMELGLIADLALGADLDGAETWQWPGLIAPDIELGAPPDDFAPMGQRWGAPPWRPQRLAQRDFAPFDALLDANMRDAGAIRIDHVMGLMRQFWIPRGHGPDQGAYVDFPFEALLARVVQASRRHRCAVIGEDLGNVPDGLRARMADVHMLGYRVACFERDGSGRFRDPAAYPPLAAAAITTHDLATVRGFREHADIIERRTRGMYLSAAQAAAAEADRTQALQALDAGLAPFRNSSDPGGFPLAFHRYLAATASRLVIVQLEDVLDMRRQANLPGLGDEAPNWRQRLPVAVEALAGDPRLSMMARLFAARACPGSTMH